MSSCNRNTHSHPLRLRGTQLLALLLFSLLVAGTACTEESPLGPEIDPLCGKWLGTIVDPYTGETKAESFTLTVLAGGIANGTGYMWYHPDAYTTIIVWLFFEGEITPEGLVTGEGRAFYRIVGVLSMYGEGSVTGTLESGAGTGSGELTIYVDDGYIEIEWEVIKVGSG